jgi:hypothetical protein
MCRFIITIAVLILLIIEANGQKLKSFRYSTCDHRNPHIYIMNTMINKMVFQGDSVAMDITWIDNCGFEPNFSLKRATTDTLYFQLKNESEDLAFCACAFRLKFNVKKVDNGDFQIKVNDWIINKTTKRYRTDGYAVEYYPGDYRRYKLREIYFNDGRLVAEVFYNKEGEITSERYYDDTWSTFKYEKKK